MTESIVGHRQNTSNSKEYIFSSNNNVLTILSSNGANKECTYSVEKSDSDNKLLDMRFSCPEPDYEQYAEFHEIEFVADNEIIDIGYMQGIPMGPSDRFIKIGNRGKEVSGEQSSKKTSNLGTSEIEYEHFLFIIPILLGLAIIFLAYTEAGIYGSTATILLLIGSIWLPFLPLIILGFKTDSKNIKIITVIYVVILLALLAISGYSLCWKGRCFLDINQ